MRRPGFVGETTASPNPSEEPCPRGDEGYATRTRRGIRRGNLPGYFARETVPENAIDIGSEPGAAAIRFEHVDLGYGDRRVLNGIDLTIRPNEIIGVAGASGVGKSTLVDAIAGLLEPQVGRIFVNDHPMSTLHLERWRQSIGYVTQDTYLLNGTLLENIALGDPDVERAEVVHALREVGLMDMVDDLPDGLDTNVGPGGIGLSGGQRQRVGIARALVGHKKLIIFDEPTSALDLECEQLIIQTLRELKRRRTIVLVSHRLSAVVDCDRILVMQEGRIVGSGTYAEFIAGRRLPSFDPNAALDEPAVIRLKAS